MRVWLEQLGTWLLLSICILQQLAKNIEDEVPAEFKADNKVAASVSNLKALRKRLASLGAKHPARKQFEDRVKSEEKVLSDRLLELGGARRSDVPKKTIEPSQETMVPEPIGSEVPPSPPPATERDHRETTEKKGAEISDRPKPFEDRRVPDADLLRRDTPFPWLATDSFINAGCLEGTGFMWGIEPRYDEVGAMVSADIWQWGDHWREKSRKIFWESDRPILSFHPSNRYASDGIWFLVTMDRSEPDKIQVAIQLHRAWPPSNRSAIEQVLCKGVLSNASDSIALHYDSVGKELLVGVCGELTLTEKCPSVTITDGTEMGLSLQLGNLLSDQRPDSLEPMKKPLMVRGRSTVSGVAGLAKHRIGNDLRPFWRKRGPDPSVSPKWWNDRAQRILTHEYKPNKTPEENGSELFGAIAKLEPGDMLLVESGVYSSLSRLDLKVNGTVGAPIVIEGQGPGVVITRPDATENVMNIVDSSYFALGGVEITGGSTGIRIQTADNLLIYNSTIHNVANVGVALNFRNTSSIYVVDNEIHSTGGHGEGIYAGSHDGTRATHDSHFVGNYIHDLASGPDAQGDGIEIKDRSYGNTVKWNYIVGTQYPGITVYSAGEHGDSPNVIEENVVLGSSDSGIQATADAIIQNNWISGNKTGIASRPFGKVMPRNVHLLGNTIESDMFAIKVAQWNRSDCLIANNLIYSKTRNYFHSGFGKAIYLSNQLICDLEESGGLHMIAKRTSNRLLSSTDIFGKDRPRLGTIGAIEYAATEETGPDRDENQRGLLGVMYDSLNSRLALAPEGHLSDTRTILCLGPDRQPVQIEQPILQVSWTPLSFGNRKKGAYRITLMDRSKGILYQGVFRLEPNVDSVVLSKRYLAESTSTNLAANSQGDLLLVGSEGLARLSTPEHRMAGSDAGR